MSLFANAMPPQIRTTNTANNLIDRLHAKTELQSALTKRIGGGGSRRHHIRSHNRSRSRIRSHIRSHIRSRIRSRNHVRNRSRSHRSIGGGISVPSGPNQDLLAKITELSVKSINNSQYDNAKTATDTAAIVATKLK